MTDIIIDMRADIGRIHEWLQNSGVKYEIWEGQPMADQVKLHRCTNIPDTLPSFVRKTSNVT